MPLIELNVEKPSLKRTEIIESSAAEEQTAATQTAAKEADDTEREMAAASTERDDTAESPSRRRRAGKAIGTLLVALASALTLRKLRDRRRAKRGE